MEWNRSIPPKNKIKQTWNGIENLLKAGIINGME